MMRFSAGYSWVASVPTSRGTSSGRASKSMAPLKISRQAFRKEWPLCCMRIRMPRKTRAKKDAQWMVARSRWRCPQSVATMRPVGSARLFRAAAAEAEEEEAEGCEYGVCRNLNLTTSLTCRLRRRPHLGLVAWRCGKLGETARDEEVSEDPALAVLPDSGTSKDTGAEEDAEVAVAAIAVAAGQGAAHAAPEVPQVSGGATVGALAAETEATEVTAAAATGRGALPARRSKWRTELSTVGRPAASEVQAANAAPA
mmetsp:Transcript_18725/g.43529  ORF Transcript_18725/g.43529 Transcript_18725/m.43529 type:complete len:256 (-) Transcript_18725:114-881(-)